MQLTHRPLLLMLLTILGSLPLASCQKATESGGATKAPEASVNTSTKPKADPHDYVLMKTSMGDIVLQLDPAKAPISVKNFLDYTESGAYDGTIFHRVMNGFMIQGGGFDVQMNKRPTNAPITNEWQNGLKNTRGSIAMARTPAPNSASTQFFINVVNNPNLDKPISGGAGYAVFGRVYSGMNVVDSIKTVPVSSRGQMQNVPTKPVIIEKVTRINKATADSIKAAPAGASSGTIPAGTRTTAAPPAKSDKNEDIEPPAFR